MALSKIQYRDIMHEYEMIRSANYQKGLDRKDEIYEKIPDIRKIDEEIAHQTISTTRYMITHPGSDQKAQLKATIAELAAKKKDLLKKAGYASDYLDPIYTCPACQDTGFIGSRRCACFQKRYSEILLEQSHLKESLKTDNFQNFMLDYYSEKPQISSGSGQNKDKLKSSPRDNIKKVLEYCYGYIHDYDNKPEQNILIMGDTGVGKTFLTNCIAGEILKKGHSVVYLTAQQFFADIREYVFHSSERHDDGLPVFLSCDLLIIDDLGTELNNAFINSQLFSCINERILSKKSTIINTNLSIKQIQAVYTERVSSRIVQYYKILEIYGDDIRVMKALGH